MAESLVYRSPLLYEMIMLALYGRHYPARYRAIAELVPAGSRVLDLCCGPGILHDRYLRRKGVEYTGLDVNPRFIARVNRRGGRGLVWDLHEDRPLPEADTVVMQASLYQFLPDAAPVVRRMLRAARQRVIIAEPIRNLSDSRLPIAGRPGPSPHRPGARGPPATIHRRDPRRLLRRPAGAAEPGLPHPRGPREGLRPRTAARPRRGGRPGRRRPVTIGHRSRAEEVRRP